MQTRRLRLSYPHRTIGASVDHYQVEQAVGSTAYPPGTEMSQREVDELCNKTHWSVTIVRASRAAA